MGKVRSVSAFATIILLYVSGVLYDAAMASAYGNLANVWVSSAILAAWLTATDRKLWAGGMIGCAIANEIVAAVWGIGWFGGVFVTAANIGEAAAAALLIQRTIARQWPAVPFEKVLLFLIGALLVIPACSGMIAVRAMHLINGVAFVPAFRAWLLGHGVGLVAIQPFCGTVAVRMSLWGAFFDRRRVPGTGAARNKALISLLMLATMVLLNVCVFMQDIRWPLVAPLLFALFAAVWADTLVATAMPVLVALIGAPLTIAGLGPIAPGLWIASDHLQLGIVYAGLVACCSLPVVVEQARRRQEIARLSHSAAHFQAMSQRAEVLIDELRRTAMTDALTGLPNRRAFFETLEEQALSGEPACVAMIDIDHFKLVNDQFGHAAGDAVLCQFSDIARKSFRSSDMVARIGGEEFAVILRGVDMVQACLVCQRLVDRFAATEIATTMGTVRVTISSGLATIGGDGIAAMAAADEALYEAKRSGRSRLSAAA